MATIYALSSGAGRAGIAIVRVSGPAAASIAESISGRRPTPRRAALSRLRTRSGDTIDHGVVLWFPGPNSFTGEDCVEFHTHGSRAVIAALFGELSLFPGCRPAQAGEFARRAFLNGKSDLIELEALADLLFAETESQRRMALRHAETGLRGRVEDWASRLATSLAAAEAELDFSDEDDVDIDFTVLRSGTTALALEMRTALATAARSEAMREGFVVAIIGPPNAGKSSLLNSLAGHDAAIVSDIPGTTRDTIEIRLDLGGLPVRVIDTAGLRHSEDPIEQIGVARAEAAAARADVTLWLAVEEPPPVHMHVNLSVAAQRDRFGSEPLPAWADLGLSIRRQDSIAELLRIVRERADCALGADAEIVANERQRRLVGSAATHCEQASRCNEPELLAEELRAARHALALVTGQVSASDVLDAVFGQFCIGK